jgi:hypothetical protein
MKIKRLFYAIKEFKNAIKLKGISSLLIIFFITISSFGQTGGIEFECVGAGSITFGIPDGTFNSKTSWSNGVDFQGTTGYTLRFEADNTWSVRVPNDGPRFFFSNIDNNGLPSCDSVDWERDLLANGQFCSGVVVTCISPPDPDNDGDGFPASTDCNDNDPTTNTTITYYVDSDGDGFGTTPVDFCSSTAPNGYATVDGDCDDTEAQANPGLDEIPFDTIDNDCDGEIDENDNPPVVYEYCDDQQNKVLICHNGKTKCVSINAIDAHLAHGDYLGSCGSNGRQVDADVTDEKSGQYDLVSWPNPTNDLFNIKAITPNYDDKVSIQAFDINGRLVHSNLINGNEDYQFGNDLQTGVYFIKVTQATSMKVVKVIKR